MQSACTMTSPPPDPSARWKESLESFLIDITQIQTDEKLGEGLCFTVKCPYCLGIIHAQYIHVHSYIGL